MVDDKSKTEKDIYRKTISLVKINDIALVLHTHIMSSSFVTYFFLHMSFEKFSHNNL